MSTVEDQPQPAIEVNVVSNKPTISKLRTLVKKVRKSPQMRKKMKKLCEVCKTKYLTPIIDVKTRWNSTFLMLERAAKLKGPLAALCSSEKALSSYLMTEPEWKQLKLLCTLLQKFDRATKLLSMERHSTISAYLPTFHWLLDSLQSFVEDNPGALALAAQKGIVKLEKYEDELRIANSKIPYVAVFLNPALKMGFFKEHKFRNVKEIQMGIAAMFEEYEFADNNVVEKESDVPEDELYAYMYKRPKITRNTKEFQKYLQFPLSSYKVDVLDFWRSHEADFPTLTKMARDILPVQCASVAVERDFSSASDTVTPNRCSLKSETIRQLQCLKNWYKLSI